MLELKKIRNRTKLSQANFADKIGFTQSYVSKVESGKLYPSFELLLALRKIFKFNVNKMLDDKGEK